MPIEQLYTFAAASFLILISPGPSVMFVTSQTLNGGRAAGINSVAGLAIGDIFQVLCVAMGISAIVAAYPAALQALTWLGALYLFYLAWRCLPKKLAKNSATIEGASSSRSFRDAIIVNALNPKTTLFFLAFLPAFIKSSSIPTWWQALVLGMIFVGIGIGTNAFYAALCVYGRARFAFLQSRFMQNWLPAGVLAGLGVIALLSNLT